MHINRRTGKIRYLKFLHSVEIQQELTNQINSNINLCRDLKINYFDFKKPKDKKQNSAKHIKIWGTNKQKVTNPKILALHEIGAESKSRAFSFCSLLLCLVTLLESEICLYCILANRVKKASCLYSQLIRIKMKTKD